MAGTRENLFSAEALIDTAEEVFEELAPDNLKPHHVSQLSTTYPDHGFLQIDAPCWDWDELLGYTPDAVNYAEITIGIRINDKGPALILAKVLLSRLKDAPECHIAWYTE